MICFVINVYFFLFVTRYWRGNRRVLRATVVHKRKLFGFNRIFTVNTLNSYANSIYFHVHNILKYEYKKKTKKNVDYSQ